MSIVVLPIGEAGKTREYTGIVLIAVSGGPLLDQRKRRCQQDIDRPLLLGCFSSRGASHFASIALAVLRWCKDGNVVRPLEGLQDRFG